MKFRAFLLILVLFITVPNAPAQSQSSGYSATGSNSQSTYVHGYRKKNGTYVKGYHRTKRNGTQRDNYSTKGNYDPWTGKTGTKKAAF